jgi:hypothetical protein
MTASFRRFEAILEPDERCGISENAECGCGQLRTTSGQEKGAQEAPF